MKTTMRKTLLAVLKTTLAACVVVTAALAILTFSNRSSDSGIDVGVQEAEADVWSLSFAERNKHEKFIQVLEESKMEDPRAYDWNGNRVFFSTKTTSDSPKKVLYDMQKRLVEKGVNKQVHNNMPPVNFDMMGRMGELSKSEQEAFSAQITENMKWQDDLWSGGLVPMQVSDDAVQMIGITTEMGEDLSAVETVGNMIRKGQTPHDAKAMRYLDAFRERNGQTRVTAVWSDEEFDIMKLGNKEKFEEKEYRSDLVPVCHGCERKMNFSGTGVEQHYSTEIFQGPSDPQAMLDFYHRALENRGWKRSESSTIRDQARKIGLMPTDIGQIHVYSKGNQFVTVTAQPTDGHQTLVQVMRSP